jgi:hypothetical protein
MKRLWQLLLLIVSLALLLWLLVARPKETPRQSVTENGQTETLTIPRIYIQ